MKLRLFKPKEQKTKIVFIVEDNPAFAKVLKTYILSRFNDVLDVLIFPGSDACLEQLHLNPSTIIVDYFLGSESEEALTGLETIALIKERKSEANIIVLTAWRKEEMAAEHPKEFNYPYVQKNADAFKMVEEIMRAS